MTLSRRSYFGDMSNPPSNAWTVCVDGESARLVLGVFTDRDAAIKFARAEAGNRLGEAGDVIAVEGFVLDDPGMMPDTVLELDSKADVEGTAIDAPRELTP